MEADERVCAAEGPCVACCMSNQITSHPSVAVPSGATTMTYFEERKVRLVDGGGREVLECVLQCHDVFVNDGCLRYRRGPTSQMVILAKAAAG